MTRYWVAVASLEHVLKGVEGGFAQVCHGRQGPLQGMDGGDWIIYYSPTLSFGGKDPCRSFTAIGKIKAQAPYPFVMNSDFIPWRRNVLFVQGQQVSIVPLLDHLSFIKDKKKWGYPFKRGCFEIAREDFQIIAKAMGIEDE